jgi:hypothetical protein
MLVSAKGIPFVKVALDTSLKHHNPVHGYGETGWLSHHSSLDLSICAQCFFVLGYCLANTILNKEIVSAVEGN